VSAAGVVVLQEDTPRANVLPKAGRKQIRQSLRHGLARFTGTSANLWRVVLEVVNLP